VIILPSVICALIALLLPSPRAGDLRLWRMRANIRKTDSTRPMPSLKRRLDDYLSLALGEGTNALENVLDYKDKLLAMGRLCQKDFAMAVPSNPEAYAKFWNELADAAPGAHISQQGTQGLKFFITTNLHLIAAVEDMPKAEKLVAQFNSKAREEGAPLSAPGDGATKLLFLPSTWSITPPPVECPARAAPER
jgi:hypothetical protein